MKLGIYIKDNVRFMHNIFFHLRSNVWLMLLKIEKHLILQ